MNKYAVDEKNEYDGSGDEILRFEWGMRVLDAHK
jgi:hypothetical protein